MDRDVKHKAVTAVIACCIFCITLYAEETNTNDRPESDQQSTVSSEGNQQYNPAKKSEFDRFQSETFKKAVRYFFQKKYEMAQHLLQQELENNPENYFACSYLGDIFLSKKRYDNAITMYKRALDLDPQNAENHFRLGQAYYYKERGNLAIEHFEQAYKINPNIKYSYFHIGLTQLIVLRNKQETIEAWEQYLSLAPEDPQHDRIKRAVELLQNPDFRIPPPGSDVPLQEALHLGGDVLRRSERTDTEDTSADHEEKKTMDTTADIDRDDDLE